MEYNQEEFEHFVYDREPGLNGAVNENTLINFVNYNESKSYDEAIKFKEKYEDCLVKDVEEGRITFSQYRVINDSLYKRHIHVIYLILKKHFFNKKSLQKIKEKFLEEHSEYDLGSNKKLKKKIVNLYLERKGDKRWVKANSFLSV